MLPGLMLYQRYYPEQRCGAKLDSPHRHVATSVHSSNINSSERLNNILFVKYSHGLRVYSSG